MSSDPQTGQPNPQGLVEKSVNRACEACRLLKARCLPDKTASTATCQRCNKSGRMCVYAAPQKRRQRVRTDARVAVLERKIQDMQTMLTVGRKSSREMVSEDKDLSNTLSKEKTQSVEGDRLNVIGDKSSLAAMDLDGHDGQTSRRTSQPSTPEDILPTAPALVKISRNEFELLAPETADWLFNSFKNVLVHHFPGVIISPDTTPEVMRKSRPILFQAIVTAAAYQADPDTLVALSQEMTKTYACRIFLNGEKSLEIVQAMITSVVWYCPPNDGCQPGNLQFYQYIHMAAAMAVDLGIGTTLDSSANCLEECRILLACYLNCSGVAMRMRRPTMMPWTNHMVKCLEFIKTSPLATPLDICLVGWVKLQRITSEWSSIIRSASSNVQVSLNGYQRQRDIWKDENSLAFLNVSVALSYHQDNIFVHECVLEGGPTKVADLKPTSFVPNTSCEYGSLPTTQIPLSLVAIAAVMVCVESSHALLDIFLSLDSQTLQGAPIIFYVRMVYAIVVMVKFCLAASAPSSELGKILDPQILKVDYYMAMILERLNELAGPKMHRVLQKWLKITSLVQQWYQSAMAEYARAEVPEWDQSTSSVTNRSSIHIPNLEDGSDGANQLSWSQADIYPREPSCSGTNTATLYSKGVAPSAPYIDVFNNAEPSNETYNPISWVAPDPPLTFMDEEYMPMDTIPGEFSFLNDPSMIIPRDAEMAPLEATDHDWSSNML